MVLKCIQYRSQALDSKKVKRQKHDYGLSFFHYDKNDIQDDQFSDHISLIYVIDAKLKIIGKRAFEHCIKLQRFDSAPKLVDEEAFANCWALTDFNWLALMSMQKGAFKHSGLKTFYSSDTIEEVPEECFLGCTQLSKVYLNNLVNIEKKAFYMTGVRVLNLPLSLDKIGPEAFHSCFYLSNIVCERPTPPKIFANSFTNDPIQNIWLFSEEQKQNYLKNKNWKKFENKMRVTTPENLRNFLINEKARWIENEF